MMPPGMRRIPDPEAEMERLAAKRKPSGPREVAMTVERCSGMDEHPEWMVTVERGNAASVQVLYLTAMERAQLAALLANDGSTTVTFTDVTA